MSGTYLTAPTITEKVLRRFWKKVNVRSQNECWPWLGSSKEEGYGRFWIAPHMYAAHSVSLFLHCGTWPSGLCTLHRCDNPRCCNPLHLFFGTDADNVADMHQKGRQAMGEKIWRNRRKTRGRKAKLTPEHVREIRRLYALPEWSQEALGKRFGVSQVQIGNIVRREFWRDV